LDRVASGVARLGDLVAPQLLRGGDLGRAPVLGLAQFVLALPVGVVERPRLLLGGAVELVLALLVGARQRGLLLGLERQRLLLMLAAQRGLRPLVRPPGPTQPAGRVLAQRRQRRLPLVGRARELRLPLGVGLLQRRRVHRLEARDPVRRVLLLVGEL